MKSYSDFRGNLVMMDNGGLLTQYVYDKMGLLRCVTSIIDKVCLVWVGST